MSFVGLQGLVRPPRVGTVRVVSMDPLFVDGIAVISDSLQLKCQSVGLFTTGDPLTGLSRPGCFVVVDGLNPPEMLERVKWPNTQLLPKSGLAAIGWSKCGMILGGAVVPVGDCSGTASPVVSNRIFSSQFESLQESIRCSC